MRAAPRLTGRGAPAPAQCGGGPGPAQCLAPCAGCTPAAPRPKHVSGQPSGGSRREDDTTPSCMRKQSTTCCRPACQTPALARLIQLSELGVAIEGTLLYCLSQRAAATVLHYDAGEQQRRRLGGCPARTDAPRAAPARAAAAAAVPRAVPAAAAHAAAAHARGQGAGAGRPLKAVLRVPAIRLETVATLLLPGPTPAGATIAATNGVRRNLGRRVTQPAGSERPRAAGWQARERAVDGRPSGQAGRDASRRCAASAPSPR